MFGNKTKALTFSYDDGTTQDIRLIKLFDKYGMKATFNLNSDLLGKEGELLREGRSVRHDKVRAEDLKYIYADHEVAAHSLTHPRLPEIKDDAEIIRQTEEDRQKLSALCGYEVEGFAYPCGGVNFDCRVSSLIRNNTGIKYCRTIISSHSFAPQEDLYEFNPTVYHHGEWDKLFELGEKFLSLKNETPAIFYVWGHSFEFDIHNDWQRFESFLEMMSGREDIFYGTNREVLL